jgi:hypothetical protein
MDGLPSTAARRYNHGITAVKTGVLEEGSGVLPLLWKRRAGEPRRARTWALWLLYALPYLLLCRGDAWGQYRATQWTADSGLPQNSV